MNGDLKLGEPHPSAQGALRYVLNLGLEKLMMYQGAFSTCAIESNRLGEVCSETLRRVMNKEPVSDRYIMGLALALMDLESTEGSFDDTRMQPSLKRLMTLQRAKFDEGTKGTFVCPACGDTVDFDVSDNACKQVYLRCRNATCYMEARG